MNITIIDATEDEIQLIESSPVEKNLENFIVRVGSPNDQFEDLVGYKNKLEAEAKRMKKWMEEYEKKKQAKEQGIEYVAGSSTADSADDNEELVKETTVTENSIDYIICHIDEYNDVEAFIKVGRDSSKPLTNIEILACYTKAYQWMYKEEESDNGGSPGNIPGMLNRARSHGRYEIYGHDISDLVYNGFSEVRIYKNFVYCDFSVDS